MTVVRHAVNDVAAAHHDQKREVPTVHTVRTHQYLQRTSKSGLRQLEDIYDPHASPPVRHS